VETDFLDDQQCGGGIRIFRPIEWLRSSFDPPSIRNAYRYPIWTLILILSGSIVWFNAVDGSGSEGCGVKNSCVPIDTLSIDISKLLSFPDHPHVAHSGTRTNASIPVA
jgi:hypothetical protein